MLKEKLKMMNGVLENGNYQLGQFAFVERSGTWIVSDRICTSKRRKVKSMETVYIAGGCLWGVQRDLLESSMGVVLLRERLDHRRNAGDLQASEIAKTIILVVNGKADVTVLFQSDELSPAFREHPELFNFYPIMHSGALRTCIR